MFTNIRSSIIVSIITTFVASTLHLPSAQAQSLPWMPVAGTRVSLSVPYIPTQLKGMVIHQDDALRFDFLVYQGDEKFSSPQEQDEYQKLIKYFMAALTVPDDNQWVNLSPYEKNRIIEKDFAQTEMGRNLLAQDYLLKQITASLMYPEEKLGQKFWDRVFSRAQKELGTTNVPMNTFNKVWILPDKATVYEKNNTVYVLENHLKVMMEEDYLSLEKNSAKRSLSTELTANDQLSQTNKLTSRVVKEIIIPELEREVNEGKNFAPLRQIYSGVILAAWYKQALKESLLGKIYTNKAKVKGVNIDDVKDNDKIYQQYLKAYKKGVFNYIKEDVDQLTKQPLPRKYFSGGALAGQAYRGLLNRKGSQAMARQDFAQTSPRIVAVEANMDLQSQAMTVKQALRNMMLPALLLSLSLAPAAQGADNTADAREAVYTFNKAVNEFNAGHTAEAIKFYQEVTTKYPSLPIATNATQVLSALVPYTQFQQGMALIKKDRDALATSNLAVSNLVSGLKSMQTNAANLSTWMSTNVVDLTPLNITDAQTGKPLTWGDLRAQVNQVQTNASANLRQIDDVTARNTATSAQNVKRNAAIDLYNGIIQKYNDAKQSADYKAVGEAVQAFLDSAELKSLPADDQNQFRKNAEVIKANAELLANRPSDKAMTIWTSDSFLKFLRSSIPQAVRISRTQQGVAFIPEEQAHQILTAVRGNSSLELLFNTSAKANAFADQLDGIARSTVDALEADLYRKLAAEVRALPQVREIQQDIRAIPPKLSEVVIREMVDGLKEIGMELAAASMVPEGEINANNLGQRIAEGQRILQEDPDIVLGSSTISIYQRLKNRLRGNITPLVGSAVLLFFGWFNHNEYRKSMEAVLASQTQSSALADSLFSPTMAEILFAQSDRFTPSEKYFITDAGNRVRERWDNFFAASRALEMVQQKFDAASEEVNRKQNKDEKQIAYDLEVKARVSGELRAAQASFNQSILGVREIFSPVIKLMKDKIKLIEDERNQAFEKGDVKAVQDLENILYKARQALIELEEMLAPLPQEINGVGLDQVPQALLDTGKTAAKLYQGVVEQSMPLALRSEAATGEDQSFKAIPMKETNTEDVPENLGGIDLNAANLNLIIKRDGKGVPLPFSQQDPAMLGQIEGLVPIIIDVKPIMGLPILSELRSNQAGFNT